MMIHCNVSLSSFDFWSGARDTAKYLTEDDFRIIEEILEDLYPEGMDETAVNDLFWFDNDTIAEWLGYPDFDELIENR